MKNRLGARSGDLNRTELRPYVGLAMYAIVIPGRVGACRGWVHLMAARAGEQRYGRRAGGGGLRYGTLCPHSSIWRQASKTKSRAMGDVEADGMGGVGLGGGWPGGGLKGLGKVFGLFLVFQSRGGPQYYKVEHYDMHNTHMLSIDRDGNGHSDWDPDTKLRFVIRESDHLQIKTIAPFDPAARAAQAPRRGYGAGWRYVQVRSRLKTSRESCVLPLQCGSRRSVSDSTVNPPKYSLSVYPGTPRFLMSLNHPWQHSLMASGGRGRSFLAFST